MVMKLGMHVYLSVSMTTIDKKIASGTFPVTTSSLLKLVHHAMHGGETWYTCTFQHFHDDHEQKMDSGTFFLELLLNFSNLQTMECMDVKLGTHVYFTVSMTIMNKKLLRVLFLITTTSLLKFADKSGKICTQVYLSVSMMNSRLRHSISIHSIGIYIGACAPLNDLY